MTDPVSIRDFLAAAREKLRKDREEDLKSYGTLEAIADDIELAIERDDLVEMRRLTTLGCDKEYALLLECEGFGPLSDALGINPDDRSS